jgi:hypothetical protein
VENLVAIVVSFVPHSFAWSRRGGALEPNARSLHRTQAAPFRRNYIAAPQFPIDVRQAMPVRRRSAATLTMLAINGE